MKNQKGFSLIELMIVVVIIGILATVGIPQYQKFQMKAKQSEAKSLLSGMYTAQKAFFAEWTQYYGDFNAVGYGLEGDLGYLVGFTAAGPAAPLTHPNPVYAGNPALVFDAANFCGGPTCDVSKSRAVVGNLPASVISATVPWTFTFGATANIDDDIAFDTWTINQVRDVAQPSDDIVL